MLLIHSELNQEIQNKGTIPRSIALRFTVIKWMAIVKN